jgi:hypothetical protein
MGAQRLTPSAALLAILLATITPVEVRAADFYAGKTLAMIVGYARAVVSTIRRGSSPGTWCGSFQAIRVLWCRTWKARRVLSP